MHHAYRDRGNPPTQEDGITELGRKDAEIVADLFKDFNENYPIKAIYSSSFYRCMETARIVNQHINAHIIEDERFNELGSVIVNGEKETWVDCQRRLLNAIKEIVYSHNDEDSVICVTSGVKLTAFISLAYGINPSNSLPFPMVPSCSPIGFNITKESFEKINF